MYQVLYRKWRSRTFLDVYGQPQVTSLLMNSIISDRISHAYLFTGSRGTGKTSCAKILAKAVNCLHPVKGNPCNECEICRGIDSESIIDVVEMDAASNNGVDDIRMLRDKVNFKPQVCKYLVYIIDEVHMLSPSAFNALLKTLEEPPSYVIFILATTESHKIPATVLSRCQRLNFRRIAPEDIAKRLQFITEAEGGSITDAAAMLIAKLSDGGMRDAVSLLDQCLGRGEDVTEELVSAVAGLSGAEHILTLSEYIRKGSTAEIMEQIAALYSQSKDMLRLCDELIAHFRSIMIIKTVKKPELLLTAPTAELERLREEAESYSLSESLLLIDLLSSALEKMGRGSNRRVEMEMCLVSAASKLSKEQDSGGADNSSELLEALGRRVSELEKKLRDGVRTAPPAAQNKAAGAAVTPPIAKSTAEELSDRAVPFAQWSEILLALEKANNPMLVAALSGSAGYVSDEYILIDCNQFSVDLLRQPAVKSALRDVISSVCGRVYKFGPYRPSSSAAAGEENLSEVLKKRVIQSGLTDTDTDTNT
ncbi:MAG: DNA polymerase III subunit gamma/tau [Oscillospiraceae bacterium]|jgi:DNA polymerase-3 subunit gamma/tau|nr:DNA polymerase III subunit gamma/tau [Oscillospiraceae bacterium]